MNTLLRKPPTKLNGHNGNGHHPMPRQADEIDLKELWDLDLSPNNIPQSIEIAMSTFFNATHKVVFQSGAESIVHQHSYHLHVRARSSYSPFQIMTPFTNLRRILEMATSMYEGKFLNDLPPFQQLQPTTENITVILATQLQQMATKLKIQITELSLHESPTAGVTIKLPYI